MSNKKVLFIHVPKTGGSSIFKFLAENNLDNWIRTCPTRHDPYFLILKNNHINDKIFTFSVVRNPYTRAYSYFKHFTQVNNISNLKFIDFLNFVRNRQFTKLTPWVSYPQHHFVSDSIGKFSLSKIYKFENLKEFENDFNCKLEKINIGNYKKEEYNRDYNEECISLVQYLYYNDFKFFNYSYTFKSA